MSPQPPPDRDPATASSSATPGTAASPSDPASPMLQNVNPVRHTTCYTISLNSNTILIEL